MTSQTAVAKLNVPVIGDSVNVPGDMLALAQSAERSMVPRFATAAARDAAITSAYRAADPSGLNGEGLRCYVQGVGQLEWDGAAWVPTSGGVIATFTYAGTPTVLSPSALGVVQANVPNIHGFTFTMRRKRRVSAYMDYNVSGDTPPEQYRIQLFDDTAQYFDVRRTLQTAGGAGRDWDNKRSAPHILTAGTHTMGCYFSLVAGAGSGQLTLGALTVTLIDEGPGA